MIQRRAQLGEQMMIFVFIFFLVMIGAGIVIGTFVFVGAEFDFRQTEASLLSYKVKQCLDEERLFGMEKMQIGERRGFFMKECGFNESSLERNNLVKICKGDVTLKQCIDLKQEDSFFSTGGNFQVCDLNDNDDFAGCSSRILLKEGQKYTVLTISKQSIRRKL